MYLKDAVWNQMYIGLLCSAAIYEPFTDIIGEDCHMNKHVLVSQNLDDARIDRWPCNTDGAGHNSKDTEHNAKWRHAHRLCSVHTRAGACRARPHRRPLMRDSIAPGLCLHTHVVVANVYSCKPYSTC